MSAREEMYRRALARKTASGIKPTRKPSKKPHRDTGTNYKHGTWKEFRKRFAVGMRVRHTVGRAFTGVILRLDARYDTAEVRVDESFIVREQVVMLRHTEATGLSAEPVWTHGHEDRMVTLTYVSCEFLEAI